MISSMKLLLLFLATGFGVVLITTVLLYNNAVNIEKQHLQTIAQLHARMIDSVAHFDHIYNYNYAEGGARGATISQIIDARLDEISFGKTGELIIGEKKNGQIYFITSSRDLGGNIRPPVDLNAIAAEPMRRALQGKSGFMRGLDYKNHKVFAWYEPIPDLNAGIVVKLDVSEVRTPFIYAALLGSVIVLIISALVTMVFGWVETRFITQSNRAELKTINSSIRMRLYLTLVVCFMAVFGTTLASISTLIYNSETTHLKSELSNLSSSMTSLIGSVATFDAGVTKNNTDAFGPDLTPTVSQIEDALKFNPGFGETGEIILWVMSEDVMKLLLPYRFDGNLQPSMNMKGEMAEYLRKGIAGESGVIESIDYRGNEVIAAYAPIKQLGGVFVAKIDIEEIRRPYLIAGAINISLVIFLSAFGLLLAPRYIEKRRKGADSANFRLPSGLYTGSSKSIRPVRSVALLAMLGLCGLVFLLDTITPPRFAVSVAYIGVVILSSFFATKKDLIYLSGFVTVLVCIGFFVEQSYESTSWEVVTNRLYPVLIVWLATIIILRAKAAEELARQSKDHFMFVLENLPDATIITGQDGNITFANEQAEKTFGYSKPELIGMPVDDLVPKASRKKHAGLRAGFLNTHSSRPVGNELDFIGVRKSGEEFPASISLSSIESRQGLEVVANIRDITERKAVEKAKAEFISTVSHELRTPLTSIKGVLGLIKAGVFDKSPEKLQSMANIAYSNSERLHKLIDDLLDLEKNKGGEIRIQKTPSNLNLLVDEAIEANKSFGDQYGVTFTCSHPDDALFVNGDKDRLMQVMTNLLSNAVKFSEHGGMVEVSVSRHGKNIRVAVKDYGCGIPEEAQATIFDRFTQADSSDQRAKGGTGLGLSITKNIVEAHGSIIKFTSEIGKGTTFYFDLPELEVDFRSRMNLSRFSVAP